MSFRQRQILMAWRAPQEVQAADVSALQDAGLDAPGVG
jgi:hypothetical protein